MKNLFQLKSNKILYNDCLELADVLIPDEGDDADNELQQLEDENKREDDHSYSPPPTMDESMSDRGSPPIPIAAIVTLKNLPVVESPRTINISSPVERLNSPEASLNIESMSRPDSATADAVTTSTPRDKEFEEQTEAAPTDKEVSVYEINQNLFTTKFCALLKVYLTAQMVIPIRILK